MSSHDHPRTRLEVRLAELARAQHGVVTRAQLFQAGATPGWVRGQKRWGRLRSVHRGIYLTTPLPGPRFREMAALLATGPDAVICRRSAASMHELMPPLPDGAPVEVYVRGARGRPGVRSYRTTALEPDEIVLIQGVRVTALARTLLDLAADSTDRELQRALARAVRRAPEERSKVLQILGRHPRRRGVGRLRKLLEDGAEVDFTRSEAEERFLALVRRAGLPKPATNASLEGYEVDFLWRRQRLVVEVDGFAFHSSKRAFERDRRRDAALTAAGFRVVRVTWRQLEQNPELVLVRLAQALARASGA